MHREFGSSHLYNQSVTWGIWVITPVQPVCDRQFGSPRLHNKNYGHTVVLPVCYTGNLGYHTCTSYTGNLGHNTCTPACYTGDLGHHTCTASVLRGGFRSLHVYNKRVTQGAGYHTCRTSELHRALVTTPAEPASYTGRWLSHLQSQRVTQGVGYLQSQRVTQGVGYLQSQRVTQGVGYLQNQRVTQGVGYLQNQRVTRGDLHVFLSLRSSRVLFPAPSSSAFLCKSHERPATVACPRKVPVDSLETPGACWRHPVHAGDTWRYLVHVGNTRCMLETPGTCWRHSVHVGDTRCMLDVGDTRCMLEISGAWWKHPVYVGDIRCMLETPGVCWRHPVHVGDIRACWRHPVHVLYSAPRTTTSL